MGGGILPTSRAAVFASPPPAAAAAPPMFSSLRWIVVGLVVLLVQCSEPAISVELTFELLDNARDCYYEDVRPNTSVVLEYQVVTGGQYDVDVVIENPNREVLYQQVKSQYDSFSFVATENGTYGFCFSNEFSTISHKVVYMDLQIGEETTLPNIGEHITVMTLMESASQEMHKKLNSIIDYQTHHRLREATSRKRAEDLNEMVFWWGLTESVVILVTMVGQVFVMKNFFAEPRHPSPYRG